MTYRADPLEYNMTIWIAGECIRHLLVQFSQTYPRGSEVTSRIYYAIKYPLKPCNVWHVLWFRLNCATQWQVQLSHCLDARLPSTVLHWL